MSEYLIYLITILATAGVILRPFKLPEYIWACAGALLLLLFGFINLSGFLTGISKGTDVYLFLTGMMLIAECARREQLFDWLADHAIRFSKGSSTRMFALIFAVGLVVTIFMSNDATAVVLTPAVAVAMHKAKIKNVLPYLLICAFIANAASFVLPISNPANLVIFGKYMPPLRSWLKTFLIPSVFAVALTYLVLFLTQKKFLTEKIPTDIEASELSSGGKVALAGIIATVIALLIASAYNLDLGFPTAIAGFCVMLMITVFTKKSPLSVLKNISWSVLPLVAGLFVMVEALSEIGLVEKLTSILAENSAKSVSETAWLSGIATAFGCNLVNNLPAGLLVGSAAAADQIPALVKSFILIGIDLGPNLSVTGSLATILWLIEIRKHGHEITAMKFLKLGFLVMIPSLLAALGALWLLNYFHFM